jgi:hypothetical protein
MSRNIINFNLTQNEISFIIKQANSNGSKKILQSMKKNCFTEYKNPKGISTTKSLSITSTRRNRIPLHNLSNGSFTYIFEFNNLDQKIYYNFGKVNNALEWGSRHFQLKSNNPNIHVFSAGEIKVHSNTIHFNFYTGTYMSVVKNKENILVPLITKIFQKLFPYLNVVFYNKNLLFPGQIIPSQLISKTIPKNSIKLTNYKYYLQEVVKKQFGINTSHKNFKNKEKIIHLAITKKIKQNWSCGTLCRYYNAQL